MKGRKGVGRRKSKKVEEGLEPKGDDSSSDDTSATPSCANSATPSCATTREASRDVSPDREGPPWKRRRFSDPEAENSLQQLKVYLWIIYRGGGAPQFRVYTWKVGGLDNLINWLEEYFKDRTIQDC